MPTDPTEQYPELVATARELKAAGHSIEEILIELRARCPSPIQSIKAIREVFGLPLSEAKVRLHNSAAWADRRDEFDQLHSDLERATDALLGSEE